MINYDSPEVLNYRKKNLLDCDLLILGAGFEERAIHFLSKARLKRNSTCIIITYDYQIENNEEVAKEYLSLLKDKLDNGKIYEICVTAESITNFEIELTKKLSQVSNSIANIWTDISGLSTSLICSTLHVCRSMFPGKELSIIYTSAHSYYPTYKQFQDGKKITRSKGILEFLPKSMARGMSRILILETFSGHRSNEGTCCLAVFAGYDVHRSSGVIDNVNPSMLLLIYGSPGNTRLNWRENLSKSLHSRLETTRKTAVETVSTLNLLDSIKVLEDYYKNIFEDYDLTIAPICSKMQVVATYLFWEKYKEVQLVFPQPIDYDREYAPKGIGKTFITVLSQNNILYRGVQRGLTFQQEGN